MQRRVESDANAAARSCLDPTGYRVATEQQVGHARKFDRLDGAFTRVVNHGHLGARGHIEPSLNHRVITDRNAYAGIGSEQRARANLDALLTATRECAHDAGTATNVCCESTARDAMMLNYRTLMVSDACSAMTVDEHEACLANFIFSFGDVQTTQEVLERLGPQG